MTEAIRSCLRSEESKKGKRKTNGQLKGKKEMVCRKTSPTKKKRRKKK